MPSLRGTLFRSVTKHTVGAKFRRAGKSIREIRALVDSLVEYQSLPKGSEIEPTPVDGLTAEWVRAPGVRTDAAVLYLHGGAFVSGSPATCRELAARLSAAIDASFLVPDYRLAPEYPFPAAVRDATRAYRWLLDEGFEVGRLAIGGESSGGGLALQTLISARDDGMPLPGATFALSPSADWVAFDGESFSSRAAMDPLLDPETCRYTASLYVGDNDPETPLLRPLEADLSGLPPLSIHVGDRELLLSDAVRLAERAAAAGVDVELKVWPGMWHAFQAGARFLPEAQRSIDEVGRFVAVRFGERF